MLSLLLLLAGLVPTAAPAQLADYIDGLSADTLVPGADRLGEPRGSPPIAPAFRGDRRVGTVWLNSDFADPTGYSGKPIQIAVGMNPEGVITGLRLLEHNEPIVLIGIPERRVVEAVRSLVGLDVAAVSAGREPIPQVDVISGATVTVLVMGDSVIRSAIELHRSGRLAQAGPRRERRRTRGGADAVRELDMERIDVRDWQSLLGDGSVRRRFLTVGEVNAAFEREGDPEAAARPEPGDREDVFIDLYVGLATIPTVGRSLLGEAGYERLRARLEPGEHAVVVAGRGRYSFKGSGYVRGGIFDRIQLIQDLRTLRFRDRDHTRLGGLEAEGAPEFDEVDLFVIPADARFDPTEPWTLQLLVQRATGPLEKTFITFDLGYRTPDKYLAAAAPRAPPPAAEPQPRLEGEAEALEAQLGTPLWVRMWRENTAKIAVAGAAIGVLVLIFWFQDALVKRWRLFVWVRRAYLAFTLVWIGWIANAQLSVVNVLTFANSLITEFNWSYFLAAPLIFIFWSSVAAAMLFWGRGPFCGWLCPFGALQELTNNAARALKVPQVNIPFSVNERLWPIKYILFIGLFGLSLYSMTMAEIAAEVEPFKTAITLKFLRDWPFVAYALVLLFVGLFIERFFCRYLCPLGGALAIPARIAMNFGWLKRHPECGSPCQRCAKECPVQCIHPDGHINPNECIWCLHCQDLYYDDHRCPAMIQKRLKREKYRARSPSMYGGGEGKPPLLGEREAHRDRGDAHKPRRPPTGGAS